MTTQPLHQALLDYELKQAATRIAQDVRADVTQLKPHLELGKSVPQLSQVRSLANALAAVTPGETPALRLARLHELVAGQLQRHKQQPPAPLRRLSGDPTAWPADLWLYIAGRLVALRSGDWERRESRGEFEDFWHNLHAQYPDAWPAQPDAEMTARLHLRLAEALIYNLVETWEYTRNEA